MDSFNQLHKEISETEFTTLLKSFPFEAFIPFDPERSKNERALKLVIPGRTDLYIFKDLMQSIKVFSSYDMGYITKDMFLAYIIGDMSTTSLTKAIKKEKYPILDLPEEALISTDEDPIATLLALEGIEDDLSNIATSKFGDTLPLRFNKKVVNFAFLSQPQQSVHYFNNRPGIHHTLSLKDAPSIIINFEPLYTFQSDTSLHGYLTLPMLDYDVSRYLQSFLSSLGKEFHYNLHTAKDYYSLISYLVFSGQQTNSKLSIDHISLSHGMIRVLIGFKKELSSLKKRGVGAELNNKMQSYFSLDDKTKGIKEKTLNVPGEFASRFMEMKNVELVGEQLLITSYCTITFCKMILDLFFEKQPIQSNGDFLQS